MTTVTLVTREFQTVAVAARTAVPSLKITNLTLQMKCYHKKKRVWCEIRVSA